MDSEERKYWVAFSSFIGIGPKRFSLLVKYFGSAKKAWEASKKELLEIGLGENLTRLFCEHREKFDIEKYTKRISDEGVTVLTLRDTLYPTLLKEISDPPFVLYIKSKRIALGSYVKGSDPTAYSFSDLAVAVVGTRMISAYGREVTEELTSQLVANGLTIVSGMARGVDGVAHRTTIESGGVTIAVLGSGVDIIYPPEHRDLYKQIIEQGAVVSEFPLGYHPMPRNFPARNRIISGLSLGVLITEAAEDSGSLITASFAADQGREVFAVPGPITSPNSRGTGQLLKKGCKLVTGVSDILEELDISGKRMEKRAQEVVISSPEEKVVLDILSLGQLQIDTIVKEAKLPASTVGSILTVMEMKGMVKNYGNMTYGIKKINFK